MVIFIDNMRLLLVCILLTVAFGLLAQARTELCRSDFATVYSRYFKLDETATGDNYRLEIEIENEAYDNLYYSVKGNVPNADNDPLLPPYLTVQVLNPAGEGKNGPYDIHGVMTFHFSPDWNQIFKITMKRNVHEYKPQIKKGEAPQLRCYFNENLVPWEQVKLLKIK